MQYLLAVDMEGVHGVVGEPYKGLSESPEQYTIAQEAAIKEINAASKALFDNGAKKVVLWDNHHMGNNFDYTLIDQRIEVADWKKYCKRLEFAKDYNFAGIIYLGYHAKEGTMGAILSHTYSSKSIQYIKLNNRAVGELDIDTYIAAIYGIPPIFIAADNFAVGQLKEISPLTHSVITKYGKGRNTADLIEREVVLKNIYDEVSSAVKSKIPVVKYDFPAELEVRYTHMERAEMKYRSFVGKIPVKYGEDAHVLLAKPNNIYEVFCFV